VTDSHAYVDVQGVTKNFGPFKALDSINVRIEQGEFFSLLGPSGCGKTTLLRMIGGMEFPDSGRILIDGADVTSEPPHRRPTNMVFQSYAIFPHLTVAENVGYGLRRSGMNAAARRAAIEQALETVRLPALAGRKPDQLSGGQLQRVALARALILKPKVLLLDEPLAALDRKLRENMQIELRQLQKSVGITFIFVTHDQEEALTLSDRVAVMSGGQIMQCSSPRELYDAPRSRQVAEFVGEMNFFNGRVDEVGGSQVVVDVHGIGLVPIAGTGTGLSVGQGVVLALRPERFIVAPEAPHGIQGVVRNMAYCGNRTTYLVEVPGMKNLVTLSCANDAYRANAPMAIGDELRLAPDPTGATILAN
jgi:spermidine/putrescine ABC transporter ATP-binding subunit